jgi:hypothetical protein
MGATGWSKSTVKTYMSKHWKDVVERRVRGRFVVRPDFQRISLGRFLQLSTQVRNIFGKYERVLYGEVVTYEFLLPLKCEDSLRRALDDLFYRSTIRRRIYEIGIGRVQRWVQRLENESEEAYVDRVCDTIAGKFTGYSITHVAGRFRGQPLTDRAGAARMLEANQNYLIDETTAVVRFIIPVRASESLHEGTFGDIDESGTCSSLDSVAETRLIHWVFFELFVEAVVMTVTEEDEIWLVEESAQGRHLYVWRRP